MNAGASRFGLLPVLALAGAAISGYLALFELGLIPMVWDPLFGSGSEQVLTSAPARALPIPDAVLGVAGYLAEAVLAVAAHLTDGGASRRLTIALGALAAVMGLTALGLVALQALVVSAWCALCLASAFISLSIASVAIPDALNALHSRATARTPAISTADHLSHPRADWR